MPLSAVLDRLARAGEHDVELPVPPMTVSESWAGIGRAAGRLGTARHRPGRCLRDAAEAGIREIAAIIPDKPGALIVNNARADVWGRELPDAGGLPAGAAFAALTLGFLADGEQRLYRAGRWFRLSGTRGHVLVRTGAGLSKPPARSALSGSACRALSAQASDGLFTMDSAARSM